MKTEKTSYTAPLCEALELRLEGVIAQSPASGNPNFNGFDPNEIYF